LYNNKTVSGIILIAGNSNRFNGSINKNLEEINNKAVFFFFLDILNSNKYIDDIFIVVKESEKDIIQSIIDNFKR
jgi:2-C-methyl-D-erythritol 4-phosphate cytidylyltransferase